jgi:hypothetical protein
VNTAIAITAIIAGTLLTSQIITAITKAKNQACPHCGQNKTKENSA